MVYNFLSKGTPQTEAIPGREAEMTRGRSGAVAFKSGDRAFIRRCLLLGTANGSYYAGRRELSKEFIDALRVAVNSDPAMVADEILYASDGHAINNHAPILALVLLSMGPKPAKREFRRIFNQVVRTGSHFHEWMNYTKSMRGMGRLIQEAGCSWLRKGDLSWLTYQMLKYPQRYDMSFKDELRLLKPKPRDSGEDYLFGYVTGKVAIAPEEKPLGNLPTLQTNWIEWLKANPDQGVVAVKEGRLTHEMIAPIARMTQDVWQVLFEQMPVSALLRNLGSLTELGVLRADARANLYRVEQTLTDRARLKKARIHPIDVLKALKIYASGGQGGRSRKTWTPVPRICDVLERSLELSFDTLAPTGKLFLHAVDISGSMSWGGLAFGLNCSEVAATMALATAKAEANYIIRGFSTKFVDLGITKRDTFRSAVSKVSAPFGATDASVAYQWAIKTRTKVDIFCFWTDSESWAGRKHPSQALDEYRRKVNPNAKAIYTTLQANQITLVDPQDPNSFDFAGFDPALPKAIQEIAAN